MNPLIEELLKETETFFEKLKPTIKKDLYRNRRYVLDPRNELIKNYEIYQYGRHLIEKIIKLIKRVYLDQEILKSIFFAGSPQGHPLKLIIIQKM